MVVKIQPIRLLTSRLINHLSTCLPTYRPRSRLIIFNLSTSLCALWVTNTFSLLWNMIHVVDRYGCAPRKIQLIASKSLVNPIVQK